MNKYIPSPTPWVAEQVELYESSGGTDGTTLKGLPVIIVTTKGWKSGAIRKVPLMRVADGERYVLVASKGGAEQHPLWYYNLLNNPTVQIRDGVKVSDMHVTQILNHCEKRRLWEIAVDAYPSYSAYQKKTSRQIPVFLAEPYSCQNETFCSVK